MNAATNPVTKTDLAELKVELVKWIVGAIAFNLIGTVGLMLTLIKTIGH